MQCVRVSEQNRTLIWIAFTLGNPTSKAIRGSSLIYWHARFSSVCKLAESRSKLTIFDKTLKHFKWKISLFLSSLPPPPSLLQCWWGHLTSQSHQHCWGKGKCMGVSRIFGEESRRNYQWALGTGDYLSPGREGEGRRGFWGDHLIFRGTKGEMSRNWEPKREDHWKLWKDSEEDHSNLPTWKMKTWGDRESHLMLLGETTSVK